MLDIDYSWLVPDPWPSSGPLLSGVVRAFFAPAPGVVFLHFLLERGETTVAPGTARIDTELREPACLQWNEGLAVMRADPYRDLRHERLPRVLYRGPGSDDWYLCAEELPHWTEPLLGDAYEQGGEW